MRTATFSEQRSSSTRRIISTNSLSYDVVEENMKRSQAMVFSVAFIIASISPFLSLPGEVSAQTPHDPIYIDGNGNFTSANGVTGGNGTASDPYIIEGWEINASSTHGIWIRNTDAHFVIRDVHVHSGGPNHNQGISLLNITNGHIENSTSTSNSGGISVLSSHNVTMRGNEVASSHETGIVFHTCTNITVAANNVSLSSSSGIVPMYSTNARIVDNNISNGDSGGMILYSPTNVTIMNNNIFSNEWGIDLEEAANITIEGNNIFSNRLFGIHVYDTPNTTIVGNNISSNSWMGILFSGSPGAEVTQNDITLNNGDGISAHSSPNLTIRDNNVSRNLEGGIYLSSCNNSTVAGNSASWNHKQGIGIHASNGNMIENNSASLNGGPGIGVSGSINNTILNNVMARDGVYIYGDALEHWNTHVIETSNTVNGKPVYYWKNATNGTIPSDAGEVILANCTHVVVENENVSLGTVGVELGFSSGNIISNNTVSWHKGVGIQLYYSSYNIIANNTASGNYQAGIRLHYSPDNFILNNTASLNSQYGTHLYYSSGNHIADNTFSSNNWTGAYFYYSSGNSLVSNNISWNTDEGYSLFVSNNNLISGNILSNNGYGIHLSFSGNNRVYHNLILDNANQAYDNTDANEWDDSYPSGGNYWSDYSDVDQKRGPAQDQPGNDGIGDTPYIIDADSWDGYPLMFPFEAITRPPELIRATLGGWNLENLTLAWSLSPDDGDGLGSVVRYDVYRNMTYEPDAWGYELIASPSNGTSTFVDSGTGEGDQNDYFYQVCAVDTFNYSACSENQAGKFTRPLSNGPNLISIPLIQSNGSIENVLQTVQYNKAWYYDSFSQEWKWHMTFKNYRRGLWTVNHTIGLWVNVTDVCSLTVAGIVPAQTEIWLFEGWNLIGFPSFNPTYAVSDLKAEVGATRVEGIETMPPFPPSRLRVLADADMLQVGYGYWVRMEADTPWTIEVT